MEIKNDSLYDYLKEFGPFKGEISIHYVSHVMKDGLFVVGINFEGCIPYIHVEYEKYGSWVRSKILNKLIDENGKIVK